MAHKKAGGSSRNGRDSNGQRRGVKAYGGELVNAGTIDVEVARRAAEDPKAIVAPLHPPTPQVS